MLWPLAQSPPFNPTDHISTKIRDRRHGNVSVELPISLTLSTLPHFFFWRDITRVSVSHTILFSRDDSCINVYWLIVLTTWFVPSQVPHNKRSPPYHYFFLTIALSLCATPWTSAILARSSFSTAEHFQILTRTGPNVGPLCRVRYFARVSALETVEWVGSGKATTPTVTVTADANVMMVKKWNLPLYKVCSSYINNIYVVFIY